MPDVPSISPLLSYELTPLWYVALVVAVVASWYGLVWWLTRKKIPEVLATLPPKAPAQLDFTALKQRYLQAIQETETAYRGRHIRSRALHQRLSELLRQFVAEAAHAPVRTMTLAELKQSRYTQLSAAIETYYQPEFAAAETDTVETALAVARKVVNEWSS